MNRVTLKIACALCCFLTSWGLAGVPPVISATASGVLELHRTRQKEIDVQRKIQESEDQWAQQKDKLAARYQSLLEEIELLEKQNTALGAQLAHRRAIVAEADRKIVETARVKQGLQATLESIASRLAVFIETDLPFLAEERSRRLEELNALLSLPDEPLAEKCRRALEALQVETEYGRGFAVNEQTIPLDDRAVAVELLRTGRLALFFRTPDRQTVGWYDPAAKEWRTLPAKYKRSINQAAEMAMRQRPMDLVRLPLGRIETP